MSYSLLEFDDYERAPDEPHRKFATLEQIARRKMNEFIDQADSSYLSTELRNQYTALMIGIASALGIPGVTNPEGHFENEWEEYQAFSLKVQSAVASIMLNSDLVAGPRSVRLASSTKAKIEGQLSILRSMIERSDMPAARRSKLIDQLDEFGAELNRPRLNYGAVAMVASALLAGLAGVTSTLADAPNATQTVGTILKWIGQDKEAEEREQERLGPSQPMLPAPNQKEAATPVGGSYDDLDDDIPF
jgi:hypothetical protein